MLHQQLSRLALEYASERTKAFAGSEFGSFVRHDIGLTAKKQLVFLPYDLKVKASVGAGNWASVPWLGFFDPLITESATKGFYVVYLINAQTREIFLSLNQGTTAAYQSFGENRGREHLKRTALEISEKVPKFARYFDTSPIDLSSQDSLPSGYMAGHAFGRRYDALSIDEKQFYSDFEKMLAAYEALIDAGGTTPAEVMMEEAGTSDIEESRTYTLFRRIERSPNVRVPVLQKRGAVCEGCGLNPARDYDYQGPLKHTPLDVHHSKPIAGMAEGETRRYKIPDDFLVLCPTCHRVIHKQANPADLERLRRTVKFKH
ncbi:MrcB family domain-containing protein [Loktanella sp. S4079]|uniref:MrcB family domain-containing protein n=1 Tax=Loktanella sp. S4079 TaxID=579483 RepID=UPI00069769C9|nr:DUF3578 domain-containing protein [Loktanella sp. S4079]